MKKRLCFAPLLLAAAAGAAEFFVTPAGSDKNPGTAQAPFATIGRAAAAVNPGDTVKIGPGLYREQVTFKRSGKKDAPVTFAGTRGGKGEYLTIIEPPGMVLDKWASAPEIGPRVWKTPLAKRPDLVLMDGMRIVLINAGASELPPWPRAPSEIDGEMISGKLGPGTKRLPGLNYLQLPPDVRMKDSLFRGRKELLWPVIGNVLSCWNKGVLYVRFADAGKPEQHRFSVASGEGFTLRGASHLIFRDLFLRGSRCQFRLAQGAKENTVERCLLMHGSARVAVERGVKGTVIRDSVLTSGFIRGDFFQLRTNDDMRGGVLYRVFKRIMGSGSSDDIGVSDYGEGTRILGNVICKGLIGMDACGQKTEAAWNVVREMSSVGICTGAATSGKFHHNLVMNCGIPLRLHAFRHARADRVEYHYGNLFVQARNGGGFIYVHCTSHLAADAVNFDKKVNSRGRTVYTYKKNPPDPVDGGEFYIYHNTFWGGEQTAAFTVAYLRNRFRTSLPFFVFNNIFKDAPQLDTTGHFLTGPNVLYTFGTDLTAKERRDPAVSQVNKVVPAARTASIWNRNDLPGLPDLTLAPGSPALEAGLDVSRPFTANGKQIPALPGFSPGYFKGKAPAAGAFQEGESMVRFIDMYRRSEEALKMISELKKNTANDSNGGKK